MYKIKETWVNKPSQTVVDILENDKIYHEGMIEKAVSYCSNKRVAVDVGACYGLITNQLAKLFQTVESFEPCDEVYNCLKLNTEYKDNINKYAVGLSNKEGVKQFYSYDNDGRGTFEKPSVDNFIKYKGGFNVRICEVRTLDSYNFTDVDLIKIDVEKHEPQVIRGAVKTIHKFKPVVILEQKPYNTRYLSGIMDFLEYELVETFRDKDFLYVHRQSSN